MVGTRLVRFALAFALAGASGACASSSGGNGANDADPRDAQMAVEVENNHWYDMRIYAVLNGIRTRLGTVSSMTRATLRIPRNLLAGRGELRLLADPIGPRGGFMFDAVHVAPGETVQLRLENYLPLSSLSVWR